MLPTRSDVYQMKAMPLRVVGKNLHSKAEFVVYNNMKFLYATTCSSGHFVPSNGVMLGTLILVGLGAANI